VQATARRQGRLRTGDEIVRARRQAIDRFEDIQDAVPLLAKPMRSNIGAATAAARRDQPQFCERTDRYTTRCASANSASIS
jgi:hypothetical protein